MFQRIIYTSRAADGVGVQDVYDIVRTAHNRNSVSGVTGCLLFLNDFFIQVLEGAPYAVEERFKRIQLDPRHHSIVVRENLSTSRLLFPDEWMEVKVESDVEQQLLVPPAYLPGMPAELFSNAQLLDFIMSCSNAVAT
jgi:Sensors of blue-light using FAD